MKNCCMLFAWPSFSSISARLTPPLTQIAVEKAEPIGNGLSVAAGPPPGAEIIPEKTSIAASTSFIYFDYLGSTSLHLGRRHTAAHHQTQRTSRSSAMQCFPSRTLKQTQLARDDHARD